MRALQPYVNKSRALEAELDAQRAAFKPTLEEKAWKAHAAAQNAETAARKRHVECAGEVESRARERAEREKEALRRGLGPQDSGSGGCCGLM